MKNIILRADSEAGLGDGDLRAALKNAIAGANLKKVLLIPPDFTRMHSGAGKITAMLYEILEGCRVDILPALGTHDPMTKEECRAFFGEGVPFSAVCAHDWRADVIQIGEVPGAYVAEVSEGLMDTPIAVELNRTLLDPSYDLILSIGQVVPHEVVGMANYSKNLLVGCGGCAMINSSHMLGAVYGMERVMGRDFSPVRKVFDYAEQHFLQNLPLAYVLTVTSNQKNDDIALHGLFIGRDRTVFEEAVALSQQKNLTFFDHPLQKVVVFLDAREFKSTWLGNKAIYRTRMAIADGGELIILAPGVKKFGEDRQNDELIRRYGYVGRDRVLALCKENADLRDNLSVAAHLIHGSTDGRFAILYAAAGLTRDEVTGAGFGYMPYDEAVAKYDPAKLSDGFNTVGSEEIFYISNPALGLWANKNKFEENKHV